MTNETTLLDESPKEHFGNRLKSAREALGIDLRVAADQLRLQENMILMLESSNYPAHIPATFIRGYLRAYGKFLQIPEAEVAEAIQPIQSKPLQPEVQLRGVIPLATVTSSNYLMQIITYSVVIVMIALVGSWWYNHNTTQNASTLAIPENPAAQTTSTPAASTTTQPGTAHAPLTIPEPTKPTSTTTPVDAAPTTPPPSASATPASDWVKDPAKHNAEKNTLNQEKSDE